MSTTRRPRAAAQKQKRAPSRSTKTSVGTAICDELDRAEFDDEMLVMAHGHRDTARVLAALTEEQRERTRQMQEAQKVYIELAQDISYPVDARGRVHDLGGLAMMNADDTKGANSTLMAIFHTMSLLGYRKVGPAFIKKRAIPEHLRAGCYEDAHTWVDVRSPDVVEDELAAEHSQHQRDLPPDTRALAARRDREEGIRISAQWREEPQPIIKDGPRPEGW